MSDRTGNQLSPYMQKTHSELVDICEKFELELEKEYRAQESLTNEVRMLWEDNKKLKNSYLKALEQNTKMATHIKKASDSISNELYSKAYKRLADWEKAFVKRRRKINGE